MVAKKDPNKSWAEASKYARRVHGTKLTELVKQRDAGDTEAQNKINEAYGFGGPSMTKEGRAHLAKQTAAIEKKTRDYEKTTKALVRAVDVTGRAVNEVRLEGEEAVRQAKKFRGKKRKFVAGE